MWDYPRPPAVDSSGGEEVRVVLGGVEVARADQALRVLETSHPPTYYLPRGAFAAGLLRPALDGRPTVCEFKGVATYWDLRAGHLLVPRAGWSYDAPRAGFEMLRDHVALMPGLLDGACGPDDGCFVDGERVRAQAGGFYGGWITSRVRGPFKGAPGTRSW